VTDEKEKEVLSGDMPKGGEIVDSSSGKNKKYGKKRTKKIVHYGSDTSSSSPKEDYDDDSKKKTIKQNYSKMSLNYSHIPYGSNAHLLSIPLGEPPHFDGEYYSWWRHKMRSHLFSLHPSIWDIVENSMHYDNNDDVIHIHEKIHRNVQATTVILASLCRDEYNKVYGLDNAKEI
jgi:hypothetical protein